MSAQSNPVLKSEFVSALHETLRDPSDAQCLATLTNFLHRTNRQQAMRRLVSWLSVALPGTARRLAPVSTSDNHAIAEAYLKSHDHRATPTAVAQLCAAFPFTPALWLKRSSQARQEAEHEPSRRYLKRVALFDPGNSDAYLLLGRLAFNHRQSEQAALFGRRRCLFVPTDRYAQTMIAHSISTQMEIDEPPEKRFVATLRRCFILDPGLRTGHPNLIGLWRRAGDWAAMSRTARWLSFAQAKPGEAVTPDSQLLAMDQFAKEVEDLGPLTVERDFPARVLNNRVLIQAKLPDDGPWRLSGPDDQLDRARSILAYVNPNARILRPDDPDAEGARTLALVPSDDPEAFYLPCLFGHWHVYWTVLPAILDASGTPSYRRIMEYSIKTRQFVTFWYAKGHERQFLTRNRALGESVAGRMADEASRENYLETLSMHRPSYIRHFYERTCHRVQYFDYAVYRPGDVILNLGVSEGFEVPAYLSLIAPGGVLHNIDPEGYDVLGSPARAWIDGADCDVRLHHLALSDVDGEIEMETGGCWEDSRVSKRKLGQIKTLPSKRLDTFLKDEEIDRISHIKIDIEGGEGFLLDQLIEVMNTYRPQMEISIYHTVEQFLEIPDRMMNETNGYRFFFYHYCGHFGEGTLYAIPEEIEPLMPLKP